MSVVVAAVPGVVAAVPVVFAPQNCSAEVLDILEQEKPLEHSRPV